MTSKFFTPENFSLSFAVVPNDIFGKLYFLDC